MSSKQSTKQSTETGLPSWMTPGYKNVQAGYDNAVNTIDRSQWTGDVSGTKNSWDDKSVSDAQGAYNAMAPINGQFTKNAMDVASGKYLDPATNPTLQKSIDASTQPYLEQLMRQILPGLKQNDVSMNAFGSDRGLLREGQAIGDYSQSAANIAAKMWGDNYNTERAYQLQAPGLYQQAASAEMIPSQIAEGIAAMLRGDQQLDINNELGKRQLNAELPFLGLDRAADFYNSSPYRTSTSNTTTKTTPNPFTEALKIGIAGAGALSGMGAFSFLGPAAGAAGAGAAGAGAGGLVKGLSSLYPGG
jgi:hypothetical protein